MRCLVACALLAGLAGALTTSLAAPDPAKDTRMTDTPLLSVMARCRDQERCTFDGSSLFVELLITNPHDRPIGIPLAYLQKTGPMVRLVDARTRADTYLRTNLASDALRSVVTEVPPRGSVQLNWVINPDELLQFGSPVDVGAEFTVMTQLQVDGKTVPFTGLARLRIGDRR